MSHEEGLAADAIVLLAQTANEVLHRPTNAFPKLRGISPQKTASPWSYERTDGRFRLERDLEKILARPAEGYVYRRSCRSSVVARREHGWTSNFLLPGSRPLDLLDEHNIEYYPVFATARIAATMFG